VTPEPFSDVLFLVISSTNHRNANAVIYWARFPNIGSAGANS
jgi:hypothetical protein